MRDLLKNGTSLFTRRQNNILSAAFVIMVTYGASNIVGLLKTRLLISYFFETAGLLDVYYAAFVIPDTIFQLLVIGSLSAAFIPVFSRLLVKKESDAWYVASTSLNLVVTLLGFISLLIFWQAPVLSRLIAPGFSATQIDTMSTLLRILLISQIFFSVSGFLTGIIQSHQRFLIPALAPLFYNFGIVMGTIILTPSLGIYAPAIGVVIGSVLHVAIQLPLARHLGFKFVFKLDLGHPSVKEIVRLVPPRALALGIDQIEHFVSVVLASLLSAGSLSLLNVSRLLYTIPSTLFGVSIGQAALPALSRESSSDDQKKFYATFSSALTQVAFLALPVSTLFIVLRIPIIRLVFGSSSFPWTATLLTGKVLAILALSSTFGAIMHLVIRGFYALHNTKTPLVVGLISAVFNTALSIFLISYTDMGLLGLATAISSTTIFESLILFVLLHKHLGLTLKEASPTVLRLLKIISASLITGVFLWVPMRILDKFVFDTTHTIPLLALAIVTSAIGFMVYILLCVIFKVGELQSFFDLLKRVTNIKSQLVSQSQDKITEPVILPAQDQN